MLQEKKKKKKEREKKGEENKEIKKSENIVRVQVT
jgi:hypothetical protein